MYVFAATSIVFLVLGYTLGRKVDRFRRLSTIDPLTGLPNRRALESRLRDEWRRSERYGSPLPMLLIDIDGLKRINDERGHAAGDQILRGASTADSLMREADAALYRAKTGGHHQVRVS